MERVKIHQLKRAIEETRENCPEPIQKDYLDRLKMSILTCPTEFLRITKMYEEVMKIRRRHEHPLTGGLEIISNFQEKTIGGF